MNYLPQKLTKLRKHYNYSQSYIAEYLGVDVVEYMGYENGSAIINYEQAKRLANLYSITMMDMFKNSDDVPLYDVKGNTDEMNIEYFMPNRNIFVRMKNFILDHTIVSLIIVVLFVAIIVLSSILRNTKKDYTIDLKDINRLSVSETTVIYIDDSGAVGFSGSNTNGQLNDLATSNAVKVCEGDGFSVILNSDGSIVSSGLTSELKDEISKWINIVDIACGYNHVLGIDTSGRVSCVGESKACEIDGTKNGVKIFATKEGSIVLLDNDVFVSSGSFIGSSSLRNHNNVIDISSSDNILAILNGDKTINVYSKTGSYLKAERWTNIIDVACGNDFVAGLDEYGKVHIEIENDEIEEQVNNWTNIIAIDSGSDYLIAFDGKNIHGVGNNSYNQFVKEKKEKINLEKVSDIYYTINSNSIAIDFNGVRNASGYTISINVGTGLSKHIDNEQTVEFTSENMIEGKTYIISIVSLGNDNYADSETATLSFVYEPYNEGE